MLGDSYVFTGMAEMSQYACACHEFDWQNTMILGKRGHLSQMKYWFAKGDGSVVFINMFNNA